MDHGVVYAKDGMYCGWPANHGAWQWGDEMLVGFLVGTYGAKSMHYCHEPFVKLQARSLDGGETWAMERPNVDFESREHVGFIPPEAGRLESIIRVSGCYDHGGDECIDEGGFYFSNDRGRSWKGAFAFQGLDHMFEKPHGNTSRTAVLGLGDRKADLVFLSRNERGHFATDETFVARWKGDDGFEFVGWVCNDEARAVMPAVARSGERIVAVLRRRSYHRRDCWLDAFGSDDGGATWTFLSQVDVTGGHNGNPPALVALQDGRLVCAYANRSEREIRARVSNDGGKSWSVPHISLRFGGGPDIGYPRLFVRKDGRVVCVYYYAHRERPQQFIARTIFSP